MSQQAVIRAVGLTKVFRDFWQRARVKAVNDVDLEIEPGEIYGLLGPNGSGKSTSIKMLLGLLYPTRGQISIFGRPADDVAVKARIGYLPEESYLYRFLNARETLDYYGTLFQLPRRERKNRTEELLEMVGLRSAARRPVGEYSKGMARRIGLAQALINDPDLLILDEPTSGLDPVGAKLVKDIIVRLGTVNRKTILLSSHLLADVEEVCRRVTILYGGKVQVSGTMDDVLARREMIQIVCDRLAPETLREVEEVVRRREGKSLTVSIPKDRLESLFLRIVEQAHAERVETSGSAAPGEIASFLGDEKLNAKAALEALVQVAPAAQPLTPVPSSTTSKLDADALGALTGQPPAAAAKSPGTSATPRKPSTEKVDQAALDQLLGGEQSKHS